MVIKKVVFGSLLAISLSSVSLLAQASLIMTNNTNLDSTSRINDGNLCSSDLGIITYHHSTVTVDDGTINFACLGHASNCKADVYMTTNCDRSGASKIATVMFDTTSGIKSVEMFDNSYKIVYSGFTVELNGGPQHAKNYASHQNK